MNLSLYLHIPFCAHRCAYCDFNTYAGQEDSLSAYVAALCREIEFIGRIAPQQTVVHTIFFGGGTPSLLSPDQFAAILRGIRRHFDLLEEAEITIEANPGTVTLSDLKKLRALGINRISFGVQSANVEELKMLERNHSFYDVIEAVSFARNSGFKNLNLDLIYGLPEQALSTWQSTVKRVLNLHPEHISAYALTIEHGTPFGRWAGRGLLATPDPDLSAEMYEWASDTLQDEGYSQYEISNWAADKDKITADPTQESPPVDKPSFACRHNMQYWCGLPYLGLGAGAHGYANHKRYSNVLRIKTYIDRMNSHGDLALEFPISPAALNTHRQTAQEDMDEFMLTGLRLTREGVESSVFKQRFGYELRSVYPNAIEELTQLGLLEWVKTTRPQESKTLEVLRLTSRGRLLGNQVFMRFVN